MVYGHQPDAGRQRHAEEHTGRGDKGHRQGDARRMTGADGKDDDWRQRDDAKDGHGHDPQDDDFNPAQQLRVADALADQASRAGAEQQ